MRPVNCQNILEKVIIASQSHSQNLKNCPTQRNIWFTAKFKWKNRSLLWSWNDENAQIVAALFNSRICCSAWSIFAWNLQQTTQTYVETGVTKWDVSISIWCLQVTCLVHLSVTTQMFAHNFQLHKEKGSSRSSHWRHTCCMFCSFGWKMASVIDGLFTTEASSSSDMLN